MSEPLPPAYFDSPDRIVVGAERRRVSRQQGKALELLWRRRGSVVQRDRFAAVLESRSTNFDTLLKVTICRLREALRGTPLQIETVYGHGYRLVVSAEPAGAPAAAA